MVCVTILPGGRVDLYHMSPESQRAVSGIFIKHIAEGSPAARTGLLQKGDRLLEVGVEHRLCTTDSDTQYSLHFNTNHSATKNVLN